MKEECLIYKRRTTSTLTADVVSPVRPVQLISFATVTALHRCLTPVTTSVTGAEELLLGCLTCSLSKSMVNAPTPLFDLTGVSGDTWVSRLGWALLGPLHRLYGTGVSAANRLDWCSVTGASSTTVFCWTRPIHRFFEFFLRVLLCLAFLLHFWNLLMFNWQTHYSHWLRCYSITKITNNGLIGPFFLQYTYV